MNWPFPTGLPTKRCKPNRPTIRPSDCRQCGCAQDQADRARASGYTVVDAVSVIGTHLAELAKRHAHELFSRQDAKSFCDRVAQDNPKVVEDLVPKLLPLATVQRVIQNLLRERVPDPRLGEYSRSAGRSRAEQQEPGAAHRIRPPGHPPRRSCSRWSTRRAKMSRISDRSVHRALGRIRHRARRDEQQRSSLPPDNDARNPGAFRARKIDKTESAVVVASAGSRHFIRQMLETALPNVTVLSHNEIPSEVKVRSRGVNRISHADQVIFREIGGRGDGAGQRGTGRGRAFAAEPARPTVAMKSFSGRRMPETEVKMPDVLRLLTRAVPLARTTEPRP